MMPLEHALTLTDQLLLREEVIGRIKNHAFSLRLRAISTTSLFGANLIAPG